MHPAYSVIFFTTASGAGYGLAIALGLGFLDPAAPATVIANFVSLAMISAGLLSSTLHLGNPQRAWRAFSQWRSSWLSREGVLAILAFVPITLNAGNALFFGQFNPVLGIAAAILSFAAVFSTGMIYAQLKSIDAWHTGWTPACYLLFSLAGGAALASVFAWFEAVMWPLLPLAAMIALAAAWIAKWQWRSRLMTKAPLSTPESATGLGSIGSVRLLERPHMTENYLTREMGFKVARNHAAKLVTISFWMGGIVPITLLAAAVLFAGAVPGSAPALTLLAVISHFFGVLVERWLFFAEARHAVMNYYGG
jgi:DMSO reductase anchor subunit